MALTGDTTERKIWNYLKSKGMTEYGVAGLMGNLYAESGLNPINLQNSFNKSLGMTDSAYTLNVDKGKYSNFINDSAGYGLAQWTYYNRKRNLLNYSKKVGKSIGDLEMQLSFLVNELSESYIGVMAILKSATSVRQASNAVLLNFERPKDQSVSVQDKRARLGQGYYDKYAGSGSSSSKGAKLVAEAKKHLGKPYVFGANGPASFDCSGFIKYVYNTAIDFGMVSRTAFTQQSLGKKVTGKTMAGDLVFFVNTYSSGNTPNISHVGMMLGDGDSFIQASGDNVNISNLSNSYWKSHYYSTKRLLDESDTFSEGGDMIGADYISDSAIDTITGLAGGLPLSNVNRYSEELEDAVALLDKGKNSYCSIVDLTRGGEFRFYLPESFTKSLPVSWDVNSSIVGRSVPVTGYNSSGPKSIPLDLVLMAGTGYYSKDNVKIKTAEDSITKLYEDLSFLESLVYPNYDHTIVQPPSVVLLSCGSKVRLKGVINGLNITYYKPVDSQNRSLKVGVNITVSQVSDEPPGISDIRANNLRSY